MQFSLQCYLLCNMKSKEFKPKIKKNLDQTIDLLIFCEMNKNIMTELSPF